MNILIPSNKINFQTNQHNIHPIKKAFSQINNENQSYNTDNQNKKLLFQQYICSPMNNLTFVHNQNKQLKNQMTKDNSKVFQFNTNNSEKLLTNNEANIKKKIERNNNLIHMIDKKEVVGKGGFGKVYRIEIKGIGKSLALKQMSKSLVISKKSVPSVMNEKILLSSLEDPFLVNLYESYQDRSNLYLILDFLPGGDLRHHLSKKKFNQEEAKFIIVCILLGLKYLHSKNVIHRDIKPQNIVLDKKGYARITDLGVARPYRTNNNCDTSGTPGYMAPEVLCRQNHTYSADYFAVGVISHQFMLRKRPFTGRSRKQIRQQILARQVSIKKHQIPDDWSLQSADFVNKLLQRKPNQRLGHNNIDQIFKHPWLRSYPVDKIASGMLQAPWQPNISSIIFYEEDYSSEDTEIKELVAQNEIMLRKEEVQQLFKGYEYKRSTIKIE